MVSLKWHSHFQRDLVAKKVAGRSQTRAWLGYSLRSVSGDPFHSERQVLKAVPASCRVCHIAH